MVSRFDGRTLLVVLLWTSLGLTNGRVSAAILLWNNAAGGSASTMGNWTPSQVPTAADQLIFALNNTYTVTFNNAVPATQSQTYRDGIVTLNLTSPHQTNTLSIADTANNPIVTLATGQLTTLAVTTIGTVAGGIGFLNINDSDADLIAPSQLVVGNSGSGTLNLTLGGHASTSFLTVGHAASAAGSVFLSAAASTSNLDVTNSAVIGNSGDATLAIDAGGVVDVGLDMLVAANTGSNSDVAVDGLGAMLFIDQGLFLGANLSEVAAGDAELTVGPDGFVFVGGTVHVGDDPQGGVGSVHMTGGLLVTSSMLCGSTGASLDLDDGALTIGGGVLDPPGDVLLFGSSSGGSPVLTLTNGATMTAAAAVPGGVAINIGQGQLHLDEGATASVTQGNTYLESTGPEPATLIIDDGASLDATAVVHVGLLHDGHITVNSGGQLIADNLFLASLPGGFGSVDVTGGGEIVVDALLRVGGQTTPGGTGILTIHNGSSVTVNGSGVGTHTYPQGTIVVEAGGTFTTADVFSHFGLLNLNGGVVNVDAISIGGSITGTGEIHGKVSLGLGGDITATGPLTLGDPASNFGFFGGNGVLDVGSTTVTILDVNGAELGDTTLLAGILNLPDASSLRDSTTLSGMGLINGDLTNFGSIVSVSDALQFSGTLTSVNELISGAAIRFRAGGGFSGAGTIAANVDADAGSSITATGPLTMGNAASASGVILDGELHVGTHAVTLNDSNGAGLGPLTTIAGGTLALSAGNAIIAPTDTLRGFGAVQGGVINVGLVDPDTGLGTLSVSGTYSHAAPGGPGDLKVNLNNVASSRLQVGGTATLTGTLILNRIGATPPAVGQQFQIITAPTIVGTFSNTTLIGFPSCISAQVIYSPTDVKVNIVSGGGCTSDVAPAGGDGVVNVNDLLAVINAWGVCPSCSADIEPPCGNGLVNVNDLLAVVSGWGDCP